MHSTRSDHSSLQPNQAKQNRGKWLILLIIILSCATILPLSWNAIQAQRAQQKTMRALKQSLREITTAVNSERCHSAAVAPARALNSQAHNIDNVFVRLSQAPGEFARLSRALVLVGDEFSAQAKFGDCQALRLQLPEIQKRCDACHALFHPQTTPKRKLDEHLLEAVAK